MTSIKARVHGLSDLTIPQVLEIVNIDNKQRMRTKTVDNELYIRANQGHSAKVGALINDEDSLTRLKNPIDGVFHGTFQNLFEPISEKGLNRMNRKHIHIAKSYLQKELL